MTTRKKKDAVQKAPTKPRITAEQRKDWKTLATADWNTLTFCEYFRGMNEEHYGIPVENYAPMRNWRFEQGVLKRSLDAHGPELLRAACDEAFRTHRPSTLYPQLTAGFACNYVINGILPRLMAEKARVQAEKDRPELVTDYDAINNWL